MSSSKGSSVFFASGRLAAATALAAALAPGVGDVLLLRPICVGGLPSAQARRGLNSGEELRCAGEAGRRAPAVFGRELSALERAVPLSVVEVVSYPHALLLASSIVERLHWISTPGRPPPILPRALVDERELNEPMNDPLRSTAEPATGGPSARPPTRLGPRADAGLAANGDLRAAAAASPAPAPTEAWRWCVGAPPALGEAGTERASSLRLAGLMPEARLAEPGRSERGEDRRALTETEELALSPERREGTWSTPSAAWSAISGACRTGFWPCGGVGARPPAARGALVVRLALRRFSAARLADGSRELVPPAFAGLRGTDPALRPATLGPSTFM